MSKYKQNKYEKALYNQWLDEGHPEVLIPEVYYSDLVPEDDPSADRKWRFDFHVQGTKLLIEVQGYGAGHGGTGQSHTGDIDKYRNITIAGYTVLFLNSYETLDRPDIATECLRDCLDNRKSE